MMMNQEKKNEKTDVWEDNSDGLKKKKKTTHSCRRKRLTPPVILYSRTFHTGFDTPQAKGHMVLGNGA